MCDATALSSKAGASQPWPKKGQWHAPASAAAFAASPVLSAASNCAASKLVFASAAAFSPMYGARQLSQVTWPLLHARPSGASS